MLWLTLTSDKRTPLELTDYAERYLVGPLFLDRRRRPRQVGGKRTPAMRVWLDRRAMAARGLTVADIERAVRSENVETPAGSLQSQDLVLHRPDRAGHSAPPDDFANMVVAKGADGVVVRLGDVARVEFGAEEDRNIFRGNGLRWSASASSSSRPPTWSRSRRRRARGPKVAATLPDDMNLGINFDGSIFVSSSINEVFITLGIAVALVVGVIFVFLGTFAPRSFRPSLCRSR